MVILCHSWSFNCLKKFKVQKLRNEFIVFVLIHNTLFSVLLLLLFIVICFWFRVFSLWFWKPKTRNLKLQTICLYLFLYYFYEFLFFIVLYLLFQVFGLRFLVLEFNLFWLFIFCNYSVCIKLSRKVAENAMKIEKRNGRTHRV